MKNFLRPPTTQTVGKVSEARLKPDTKKRRTFPPGATLQSA
ncbi:hypothetical protein [Spirosoma agri]|nr:hypothetical protein [Spirosoma agri]